jgi:hypothetical protein
MNKMDQNQQTKRTHLPMVSTGYESVASLSTPTQQNQSTTVDETFILDNIIVGYAFGPKKMETMGLIMAEASKALSTFVTPTINTITTQQRRPSSSTLNGGMEVCDESSLPTTVAAGESSVDLGEKESASARTYCFDDDEDERSLSSTRASSIVSQRSQRGGSGGNLAGIQLTFLPDTSGFVRMIRTASSAGMGDGEQSITGSSMTTTAAASTTSPTGNTRKHSILTMHHSPSQSSRQSMIMSHSSSLRRHPIRVSFVPIDLDTPLEEQHGGKFDVILHKMTEDILCMSKMFRSQRQNSDSEDLECGESNIYKAIEKLGVDCTDLFDGENAVKTCDEDAPSYSMTRHQERAARRIQRLREYKQKAHPSCVLVDSPTNILAVMSRADMAERLSSCLEGITTKGGIPVRTPRFRVVEEGEESSDASGTPPHQSLATEIDQAGFHYPLIAKPLTAAGTKSSHHMGIVMGRDGLQRLKTPCLLQEYANHGGQLFKVYVLGDSVWVFSRESLPDLPIGENEILLENGERKRATTNTGQSTASYVEFERPAGSRCYVEFNSQRPYPKLSDFGILGSFQQRNTTNSLSERCCSPQNKKPRMETTNELVSETTNREQSPDLACYVTTVEIEPVTHALRAAFGLELFGFDVLVKYDEKKSRDNATMDADDNDDKEILVVDVNYFPGYKEVPHFPSLLAQYLTQKAVESRMNMC